MLNLIIKFIFLILMSTNFSLAKDLDHTESLKLYDEGILIIDVRNKSEWKETGIIPNSKLIQMLTPTMTLRNDFIENLIAEIGNDKSIQIGIICKGGGRSSATVAMLKEKGYENIYNFSEGIVGNEKNTGWVSRGYPTIPCGKKCD